MGRRRVAHAGQIWLRSLVDAREVIEANFKKSPSTTWRFQNSALWQALLKRSNNSTPQLHAVYRHIFEFEGGVVFDRAKLAHLAEIFDCTKIGDLSQVREEMLIRPIENLNSFTGEHLEWFADWIEAGISWVWYLGYRGNPTNAWRNNSVEGRRAMTASMLAHLPNHVDFMSPWAFAHMWQGGVGYKGQVGSGLVTDCKLTSQQDWPAILVAASKIRPAEYGFIKVDEWLWKVFPIAKHKNWTATEAAQLVCQKFDVRQCPGRQDENGFAQHFRKIGLRFKGRRRRDPVPGASLALSL